MSYYIEVIYATSKKVSCL